MSSIEEENTQLQQLLTQTQARVGYLERRLAQNHNRLLNTIAELRAIQARFNNLVTRVVDANTAFESSILYDNSRVTGIWPKTFEARLETAVACARELFGQASAAIIEQNELANMTQPLQQCAEQDHQEWYWVLVNDGGMDEHMAYALVVALHENRGVEFDAQSCTLTPYSPWNIH
ncbi:hypothetical protein BC629DRAFT_1441397 [Irpex lacteus]|nr:hypothetical protein BC629DRAFT_1441397 [Irpex lacteus]